jgi:hypothetical protein
MMVTDRFRTFYFDDLFLQSLRSGYLKRLNFDYCLWLDKQTKALSRFLYSHVVKRLGTKDLYSRTLQGLLQDVGLGYLADEPPRWFRRGRDGRAGLAGRSSGSLKRYKKENPRRRKAEARCLDVDWCRVDAPRQ